MSAAQSGSVSTHAEFGVVRMATAITIPDFAAPHPGYGRSSMRPNGNGTSAVVERSVLIPEMIFGWRETIMIYRMAVAVVAGLVVAGAAAAAQSTAPSSEKQETSCTTSSAATSGSAGEKTANSMAVEKSAILPEAGGSNSAAPTVQSGGKPMEVRTDCPPDSKPR